MISARSEHLRQYDVVRHPNVNVRSVKPFLIVLQARYFDYFATRVVAPLVPKLSITPNKRLNPGFVVQGQSVVFIPTDLANVPVSRLGEPVANLSSADTRILDALDLEFSIA